MVTQVHDPWIGSTRPQPLHQAVSPPARYTCAVVYVGLPGAPSAIYIVYRDFLLFYMLLTGIWLLLWSKGL